MAYYNFLSEYKNKPLDTELSKQYEDLQPIISTIMTTNEYRKKMNANYQRRREILYNHNV